MKQMGGRTVGRVLPLSGAPTRGRYVLYTAQDYCLIKDPRSEAMRAVDARQCQLLIVMGRGRQGGGRTRPTVLPLFPRGK